MKIAVIGAGVTGLVAAYRLTDAGHECTVYERWPGLGGHAATLDVGDALIERYYHHLFTSDRYMAELCDAIGLEDELESWPSTVAMFADGLLHPFTTPLDLLRFKPVSLWARLRMGLAVVAIQRRHPRVEPLESVTIREWVERRMGREAYEKVWGPLLRAKFSHHADEISMSWLWSRLRTRRQGKGAEARQERLVYPRGSFEAIYRRLNDRIEAHAGRVLIDSPVAAIARDGVGFLVSAGVPGSFRRGYDPRDFETSGKPERYDAVLATVPSDIFQQLLDPGLREEIGPSYLERLNSIGYLAALCLLLEIDRPFSSYYWTNVADPELRFIGVVEHTNLVPAERYGGRRYVYVANYLPRDDELLSLDADELLRVYEPGLRKLNPAFSRDWVRQRWVFREPAAQPVVECNYRERMPPLDTGVPGLVLANTTQVYPEDRGTNYAVRLAGEAVDTLLAREPGARQAAAA